MAEIHLLKTAIVLAGTNDLVEYIPYDGEVVLIANFKGSAPESSKAEIVLLWDWVALWNIQGEQPMPDDVWFEFTGDGVKKVTLCLANGCTSDYRISGSAILETS